MITIIVLLILAAVSVSLVMNGGIVDKAEYGTRKYSEEEELEQIKLAVTSATLSGNGFLTTKNLNNELNKVFNNEKVVRENNDFYTYKTDKNYRIYKDGRIEEYISPLPKEYQQVEYIESTGTQYILTGITYEVDYEINCEFQLTELKNDYQTIMGQNTCDVRIDSNGYLRGITELPYVGLTKHNCKIVTSSNNTRNVILDDERYSFTHSYIAYGQCAIFTNGSNVENRKCKAKFYSGDIYLMDELKARFVPCYRKSDNKPGVYNLVENTFLVNQNNGTDFIIGPEI